MRLLAIAGPGVMVMLADTDAGSVITAAQSGALYGYQLVASQVILIPVLYLVQEMTARLGLVTGQGHGALIRATFGSRWALLSAATLFAACVGALVTEFAGLAGVGALVGLPRVLSVGAPAVGLVTLVLAGRYRRVEHVGIAIGALELLFVPAAILTHPRFTAVVGALGRPVEFNPGYLSLLAANVGAVIMPWMVFYQQEAVIDRDRSTLDAAPRLRRTQLAAALRRARVDTALGALLTQVVMIAVVVAVAATVGAEHPGTSLNSIAAIADALSPFLGGLTGATLFGLGMLGAATVAALVVSLAGAWGMSEVLGWRHSLNDSPRRAPGFYALIVAATLTGASVALLARDLVNLSVDVEVMNAGLLPIVLGFLLLLERRALPREYRMHGPRRAMTYALTGVVISLGLYTVLHVVAGHL